MKITKRVSIQFKPDLHSFLLHSLRAKAQFVPLLQASFKPRGAKYFPVFRLQLQHRGCRCDIIACTFEFCLQQDNSYHNEQHFYGVGAYLHQPNSCENTSKRKANTVKIKVDMWIDRQLNKISWFYRDYYGRNSEQEETLVQTTQSNLKQLYYSRTCANANQVVKVPQLSPSPLTEWKGYEGIQNGTNTYYVEKKSQ